MCVVQFSYYDQYNIFLGYIGFCILIGGMLVGLSILVAFGLRGTIELDSAYECGFIPFDRGHTRFEVNFFLVGLLFLFFDLEVVFLISWGCAIGGCSLSGICGGLVFLVILAFSFVYEVASGALEAENI